MNVLVSVVVPVYNLGEYLDTCLENLRKQTLRELEIICVDDGSTDNSLEILKRHAREDSRVIVRQQKNQGAGPARNNALSAAAGKYVVFMDGDDLYPAKDTLEKMVTAAREHKVRVVAGYRSILRQDNASPDKNDPLYEKAKKNPDGILLKYRDVQFDFNYQCYLFERSIITENKLEFPDYRRFQDPPFFVKAMIAADKFYLIPESTYLYRWGHQNISWTPRKINDMVTGHIDNLVTSSKYKLSRLHATTASRLGERYEKLISGCVCLENPRLYALVMRADELADKKLLKKEGVDPYCIRALLKSMNDRYADIFCENDEPDRESLLGLLKDISAEYDNFEGNQGNFSDYAAEFLAAFLTRNSRITVTNAVYDIINSEDTFIKNILRDAKRSKNSDVKKTADVLLNLKRDETENIKVSVILTPSASESKTREALISLLGQSFGDIELLCLYCADCEYAEKIIDEYSEKSDRVVPLKMPHSGIQEGRNEALKNAQGRYVLFLSADDSFDRDMIKSAYEEAEKKKADILIFKNKYSDIRTGKAVFPNDSINKTHIKGNTVFSKSLVPGNIASISSVWLCNKLYRTAFIKEKGLSFNADDKIPDISFVIPSLCEGEAIAYLDKELSVHRLNSEKENQNAVFAVSSFLLAKEELIKRGLYKSEERGFVNNAVLTLSSFLDRLDGKNRLELCREICSEKMKNSGILDKESSFYDNSWALIKLRGAWKAVEWNEKIKGFNRDSQTEPIKASSCKDPYISVIIPVYNVENYVEECIQSVLSQTFGDFEIICIDDGSTDNSRELVLKMAEKDSRISVYKQLNSGLSETRNNGVRVAKGKYVYFLDSDDYIIPEALELLYEKTKADDLDAVYFDAMSFTDSSGVSNAKYDGYYNRSYSYDGIYTGIELMRKMYRNGEYRVSACLQMVKREHFISNDLFFLRGIIYEDNPFTFKNLLLAKRAGYIGKSLYMRRVRDDSIMTASVTFKNAYSYFRCFLYMEKFFSGYTCSDDENTDAAGSILHDALMSARYSYEKISAEERMSCGGLSSYERNLFDLYISAPCTDRMKLKNADTINSSTLKKLKKYLKKVKKLKDKSSSPADFMKKLVSAALKKIG